MAVVTALTVVPMVMRLVLALDRAYAFIFRLVWLL